MATSQSPSILGALKNIGRGLYLATAKFANYNAAFPTMTTRVGARIGTNPNSTIASIQRVAMNWTGEDVAKNCPLAAAYLKLRINYCSSVMRWIPDTGDSGRDADVTQYLHGDDGTGGIFSTMGVDCSMQSAFMRAADIETPVRGDAGLIIWEDAQGDLRLINFAADQLGEIYNYGAQRYTSLNKDASGKVYECPGNDILYYAGRYFRGADCVAYKVYERTNAFYANPTIYEAANVIYFRDHADFGGMRGVTLFAAALQHMEKGERLFQIGMDAALRQAKTAMVVMNQMGQPDEGAYETDSGYNGRVRYQERIPEGPMVEYFYNGDSANFTSPDSPGPELIQGVETSDMRVALALGLPYAFLVNPEAVGGAPSRLEVNKASKEWMRIQNTIHRPRLNRISRFSILDAVNKGLLPPARNLTRGRWMLPISPTVDAGYSNDENITNLRAGLECPQDLVAETNRDWKTILRAKKQAAIDVQMAVQDANRELEAAGYDGTVSASDVAQLSDNPQQQAAAEAIDRGKPAKGGEDVPTSARVVK